MDISVLFSVVTAAVTLGIALGRLAAHAERLNGLERFRERAGERLQRLEEGLRVETVKRKLTRGQGVEAVPERIEQEESSNG